MWSMSFVFMVSSLLSSVLQRFEDDMGEDRKFLKATLCLLEMSKHGLLEDELLQILAGIHKRGLSSVISSKFRSF